MEKDCLTCKLYQEKGSICQLTNTSIFSIEECSGYEPDRARVELAESEARIHSLESFAENLIVQGVDKEEVIKSLMSCKLSREEAEIAYNNATPQKTGRNVFFNIFGPLLIFFGIILLVAGSTSGRPYVYIIVGIVLLVRSGFLSLGEKKKN